MDSPFDDVDNNYTILHQSSKVSYLIKIDFINLLKISNSWYGNRRINNAKVNELYESITDDNYYIWTLVAVKELASNELYIIDGQHRCEAIRQKMLNEPTFDNYVYCNVYTVETINDSDFIIDLFKKINNNILLNPWDMPVIRITKIVETVVKDPILKKGIETSPKHQKANQPRFHQKQLNAFLNKHSSYIEDMGADEIIHNLKIINTKLSKMSFQEIFKFHLTLPNENAHNKAKELNFFIGLTGSFDYNPIKWIKHIKNPDNLFK
jgi:hypothetical protein